MKLSKYNTHVRIFRFSYNTNNQLVRVSTPAVVQQQTSQMNPYWHHHMGPPPRYPQIPAGYPGPSRYPHPPQYGYNPPSSIYYPQGNLGYYPPPMVNPPLGYPRMSAPVINVSQIGFKSGITGNYPDNNMPPPPSILGPPTPEVSLSKCRANF